MRKFYCRSNTSGIPSTPLLAIFAVNFFLTGINQLTNQPSALYSVPLAAAAAKHQLFSSFLPSPLVVSRARGQRAAEGRGQGSFSWTDHWGREGRSIGSWLLDPPPIIWLCPRRQMFRVAKM